MKTYAIVGALAACLVSATFAHADTVTKSPDLGGFWDPLATAPGTYVYANSFVAPITGSVKDIGLWLDNWRGDTSAQPIAFEVLGSSAGGPDASDILATTGVLTLDVTGPLALYSASTTSSATLVAGQTYWVAGDERGLSGLGKLQAGAHTQNSGGIVDDGTFWASNNQTGAVFDIKRQTPEMAFTVDIVAGGAPEPATWATLLLGVFGAGALLRNHRRTALA